MKDPILHMPKTLSSANAKKIVKYLPRPVRRRLPAEISVVAVSEQESRRLNRRYRGKDKSANVLSFLYDDTSVSSPRKRGSREQKTGFPIKLALGCDRVSGMTKQREKLYTYGEIIVCPSIVRAEAKAQRHTYQYQMTWMIVHGMIHLSGLHHEQSEKLAEQIERLERKLLESIYVSVSA